MVHMGKDMKQALFTLMKKTISHSEPCKYEIIRPKISELSISAGKYGIKAAF